MVIAQILYLTTMMWKESLPFDVMTPWYDLLPNGTKDTQNEAILRKSGRNLVLAAADPDTESAPGISDPAFWDLIFGLLTSLGSCAGSVCVLLKAVRSSRPYPDGFEMVPNSLNQSSNPEPIEPTPSGILFLERGELIFTIFGLLAEAATFVIDFNVYNAHDETVVPELIPLITKFYALFLKALSVIKDITGYGLIGTEFYPSIGNLLNSSVPGVIDWIYSEKQLSDDVAAIANLLTFFGGLCDIGTIVLAETGQEEIEWGPFGVSCSVNIIEAILVFTYGFKLGPFGRKT